MSKAITTEPKKIIGKIEIPSVGVGEMRASASWLIVMLSAEDPSMRPAIILETMKYLGITIEDLQAQADDKMCPQCGISLLAHEQNNGKCF